MADTPTNNRETRIQALIKGVEDAAFLTEDNAKDLLELLHDDPTDGLLDDVEELLNSDHEEFMKIYNSLSDEEIEELSKGLYEDRHAAVKQKITKGEAKAEEGKEEALKEIETFFDE